MVPAGNCFPGDALAQLPDGFRRLDELAAGDRLATYNHAERDHFEETAETRIDPETWRLVTVRQDQGDAGTIEADLLRPIDFFGGQWPNPGDELNLDLPRLGLSGPVQVTAIAACPTIPPGPGRIVLSVFRHSRGSTGALYLVGHTEPIRVTPLHPIWSPSHEAWIPAGKLTPAHDVSLWKSTCRVERYELDAREEPVYNVEVDGDHCYRVGQRGLLVHNESDNDIPLATGGAEEREDRECIASCNYFGQGETVTPPVTPVAPPIPAGAKGGPCAGKKIPQSMRDEEFPEGESRPPCAYCRQNPSTDLDHVHPRSKDGDLTPPNITPACKHCNCSKGARECPKTPPSNYHGDWPPQWWPQWMKDSWQNRYGS